MWQVCWQRTDSHELQLCSVSTDGRITLWTASKDELSHQDLLELHALRGRDDGGSPAASPRASGQEQQGEGDGGEGGEGIAGASGAGPRCCWQVVARAGYSICGGRAACAPAGLPPMPPALPLLSAGGCCFDFSREQESLFIVGSEDGSLYKCSTAHTSEYLQVRRGARQVGVEACRWMA